MAVMWFVCRNVCVNPPAGRRNLGIGRGPGVDRAAVVTRDHYYVWTGNAAESKICWTGGYVLGHAPTHARAGGYARVFGAARYSVPLGPGTRGSDPCWYACLRPFEEYYTLELGGNVDWVSAPPWHSALARGLDEAARAANSTFRLGWPDRDRQLVDTASYTARIARCQTASRTLCVSAEG